MLQVWNLRIFERRKPGQRKDPSYVTVAHGPGEVAQAITNVLSHDSVTRVDITPKGSPPEPAPAPQPVKVQRLEWEQDESYPKGERWVGRVNGKQVAVVVHLSATWGGGCHYHLVLGEVTDYGGKSTSIDAGKRAAQSAFSKFVKSLLA